MCRCIYCNSTDNLTVSDIISCALTGAKLTRKFVCRQHNAFTNNNFEKTAIANLGFFRSALGLTERSGNEIKNKADVMIDGITIPGISISGRASIYEDKKRLFHVEQDGKKYQADIDGEKSQTTFFEVGTPHIPSLTPQEAIRQNHSYFVSKLEELLKTRVTTLRKLRALTDEIITALSKYKKTKDIAQFVDYESPERVLTIFLLELLKAHEQEYDFR